MFAGINKFGHFIYDSSSEGHNVNQLGFTDTKDSIEWIINNI